MHHSEALGSSTLIEHKGHIDTEFDELRWMCMIQSDKLGMWIELMEKC